MKRNQNIGISILIAILMVFTMGGMYQAVGVLAKSLDKGLNPIPLSPPPPEEFFEDFEASIDYVPGMEMINDAPGHYRVRPSRKSEYTTYSTSDPETINSRLNLFATCDSFTDNGTTISRKNDLFQVGYNSTTNTATKSLIMFPQVRDLFPPDVIINSVKLVTGQVDVTQAPVTVDVYEITSQWDPRTFDATSIPTFSATPVVSGLIDLQSTNATNRTLDVTTTFNSWFSGSSDQWGFMLSVPTGIDSKLTLNYPFRLYVDYEMPADSYMGASSGASYYRDGICPPLWIPRRSVYILKTGILENTVIAGVFAATHTEPPFGYQVQSMDWIHDGQPVSQPVGMPTQESFDSVPFPMNVQTVSPYTMIMLMNSVPPVQAGMFWEGNVIGLNQKQCPTMLNSENDEQYELNSALCPGEPPPGPPIIEEVIIPPIEDKHPEDDICDPNLPDDPDCCPPADKPPSEEKGDDNDPDNPPFGVDIDGDGDIDYPPFDHDDLGLEIDSKDLKEIKQECIEFGYPEFPPIGGGGGDFTPPDPDPDPPFPPFPPWLYPDPVYVMDVTPPPGVVEPTFNYTPQSTQWTIFNSDSVWSYSRDTIDTSNPDWYSNWTELGRTTRQRLLGGDHGPSFSTENKWIRSGAPWWYDSHPGIIDTGITVQMPTPPPDPTPPPIISPIDGTVFGLPPRYNFPEMICCFPEDPTGDVDCTWSTPDEIISYLLEEQDPDDPSSWEKVCISQDVPEDGEMVIMGDTLPQADYSVAHETVIGTFNPRNGQTSISTTDFKIVCFGGLNLTFTRNYAGPLSSMIGPMSMGFGWTSNLDEYMTFEEDSRVSYVNPAGYCVSFRVIRDQYNNVLRIEGPEGYEDTIKVVRDAQGIVQEFLIASPDDRAIKHFNLDGEIMSMTTDTGGQINYIRDSGSRITALEDAYSGRKLQFTYDQYGRISSVLAPENRNWTYTYDQQGDLTEATNPKGDSWDYEYNSIHLLKKVINPRGYTVKEFEYESEFFYSKIVKMLGTKENPSDPEIITAIEYQGDTTSFEAWFSSQYYTSSMNKPYTTSEGAERSVIITDAEGRKQYLLMDRIGRKIALGDGCNATVNIFYQYDKIYTAQALTDNNSNCVAWVEEDNENNEIIMYDAVGEKQSVTYNELSRRITQSIDREGKTTTFLWNQDKTLIESVIDPLGRITNYNYDFEGKLIYISQPYKIGDPKVTTYGYDANGYINSVTDPMGNTTQYEYNDCGDLVSSTNAMGKTTTLTVDKLGLATTITGPAPDNRVVTRTFDECKNMISTTNPRGYTHALSYNKRNQIKKSVNALGQETTYSYDNTGKLISIVDDKGNETTCDYDNNGRIISMTDTEGTINTVEYDELGNIQCYKNTNGDEICSFEYDDLNRVQYANDAASAQTTYERDKENHITKITGPLGMYTLLRYDDGYRIIEIEDNAGNISTAEYWSSGQIKKTTDPLGNDTYFDYDKNGNIISVKNDLFDETTSVYDSLNRLTSTTDALGNTTSISYDLYGLIESVTDPLNNIVSFEYDANNNLVKKTSAEGIETEWEYDALDRVVKTITPLGYEYTKEYDNVGNVIKLKNPLGHLQKFEYTDDYQISKYIDQINNETDYLYDEHNRLRETTRPEGDKHWVNYDEFNRVTSYWDPQDTPAYYFYDEGGSLIAKYLPDLTETNGDYIGYIYHYDDLHRRTGFTDDAGQMTSSVLDNLGRVSSLSHPNAKSLSMTYDSLGRMTDVDFGGGESIDYSYDALSRITSETDMHGTKTLNYDACSRVTSVTDHFGDQYSYTYDDDGRQTSSTTQYGTSATTYDDESRPISVSLAGGGSITNTFDNLSRLITSTSPNSTITTNTYNNANLLTQKNVSAPSLFMTNSGEPKSCVETDIERDSNSFSHDQGNCTSTSVCKSLSESGLSGIELVMNHSKRVSENINTTKQVTLRDIINAQHEKPLSPDTSLATVANFTYTYDDNYNILSRTNPNGTEQFTYDVCDRLTEAIMPEGTYTYTYDLRSNITTKRFINTPQTVDETTEFEYSIDDRLTSYTVTDNLTQTVIESGVYIYDNAGCMLSKAITIGGNTDTTTYTYYDDLRIKTITLPDTSTVTYTYGSGGERATKTTSTEYIEYYYNGSLIKEVHMDANNHSTILFTVHYEPSRYTYDPGAPGGGDEADYYPVTDMSGTVHLLLDSSATQIASYTYTPFGERLTNSAPSVFMPFGYAGTYLDEDSGLLFAQSRYYDPHVARFTTKDSYRGSKTSLISQNRYIYCHQNPIKYVDPSGFAPVGGESPNIYLTTDSNNYHMPNQDNLNPENVEPINSPMNVQIPSLQNIVKEKLSKDEQDKKDWLEEMHPGYNAYKIIDGDNEFWTIVPEDRTVNADGSWDAKMGDGSVNIRIVLSPWGTTHDARIQGTTDSKADEVAAHALFNALYSSDFSPTLRSMVYHDGKEFDDLLDTLELRFEDGSFESFNKGLGIDYGGFIWATCGGWLARKIISCTSPGGDGLIVVGQDEFGNDITMKIDDYINENIDGYSDWNTWCLDYATADIINNSRKEGVNQGYDGKYSYYKRELTIPFLGDNSPSSLYSPAGLVQLTQINMAESLLINGSEVFTKGYNDDAPKATAAFVSAVALIIGCIPGGQVAGTALGVIAFILGFVKEEHPALLNDEMLTEVVKSMGINHVEFTDWGMMHHGWLGAKEFYKSGRGQVMAHSRYKMLIMNECIGNQGSNTRLGHLGAASSLYLGWLMPKNSGGNAHINYASLICASLAGEQGSLTDIVSSDWNVNVWANKHVNNWLSIKSPDISYNWSPYGEFITSASSSSSTTASIGTSSVSSYGNVGTTKIPIFPEQSSVQIGFTSPNTGL